MEEQMPKDPPPYIEWKLAFELLLVSVAYSVLRTLSTVLNVI